MDKTLITGDELAEFRSIVKKEYGIELTDEQAFEQGAALLNLFDCILKKRLEEKRQRQLETDRNKLVETISEEVK